MHYLYLITTANNETKIGISNDPEKRFKTIQAANPQKLILQSKIEFQDENEARNIETALHRFFTPVHIHSEWFQVSANSVLRLLELSALIGISKIEITIENTGTSRNYSSEAVQTALEYLRDNPDAINLNVRELGQIVGVRKTIMSKKKPTLTANPAYNIGAIVMFAGHSCRVVSVSLGDIQDRYLYKSAFIYSLEVVKTKRNIRTAYEYYLLSQNKDYEGKQ